VPRRENNQKREPESTIDTGSVKTPGHQQVPDGPPLQPGVVAAIVPATPDDSTCVVLSGRPKASAAPKPTSGRPGGPPVTFV
jgi:hypothetical protein